LTYIINIAMFILAEDKEVQNGEWHFKRVGTHTASLDG
jgi:hypothetical protein